MSVLLVYPTHKNCGEVEEEYRAVGIDAATYPGRTTDDSETMPRNCWNADADWAETIGLPVVKTICPSCKSHKKCLACGYLGQLLRVQKATVALCTHKRAEFSGLAELSSRRRYVSIHENPVDLLRPALGIQHSTLEGASGRTARHVSTLREVPCRKPDDACDRRGSRHTASVE